MTTAVLVILVGTWLGKQAAEFNAETASQDGRLTFQHKAGVANGLTSDEVSVASQVGSSVFPNDGFHLMYQGNSQTLGIFDPRPGDLTSPQWLQILATRDRQPKRRVDVRVNSLPGATLTDLLILASNRYASGQRADLIVLGLLPDEFRKSGLRDEVKDTLGTTTNVGAIRTLLAENADLHEATATLGPLLDGTKGGRALEQERWIDRIEAALEQNASRWSLFGHRDQLRGQFSLELLRLRNAALHLRADKQRPVPVEAYQASTQVLELLVRLARAHKTDVVIYLGPVLPVTPAYYAAEDMTNLQQNVFQVCEKYQLRCLDYRNLVPLPVWGADRTDRRAPGAALDFVHLPGGGHQYLARQLFQDIHPNVMEGAAGQ